MLCRNAERGEAARQTIIKETGNQEVLPQFLHTHTKTSGGFIARMQRCYYSALAIDPCVNMDTAIPKSTQVFLHTVDVGSIQSVRAFADAFLKEHKKVPT